MANIFDEIINDLTQTEPFVEYKFRKRDSMLLLKNGGKRQSIELDGLRNSVSIHCKISETGRASLFLATCWGNEMNFTSN